jgi:predicted esterase
MSETFYIKTKKTAKINVIGNITNETKNVWIVLHGYGELSNYFIRKFSVLKQPEDVIIAPEGLSRFYLNGFNGRVGATWMTKEERLSDIEDYIYYLDTVYKTFIKHDVKVHVIGFSQGAATASRWIANSTSLFHSLILWCGVFPPDLPLEFSEKLVSIKKTFLVLGINDNLISPETLEENTKTLQKTNIDLNTITFEGGHEILPETLFLIKKQIEN